MAAHADDSIIVDVDIDTSGFKAGSAELKSAISSLVKQVHGLGPTFQKAMSGNTKAMGTFEAKASALKTKIADLEAKMARLGSKRLPTEDYKYFGAELTKAKNQLAQLEAREAKMNATGVKAKSNAYKNLQYDITLTKEKILDLEATMAGMRQNGTAFQLGSATPQYQQMASALAAAKQQMAEMDAATSAVRANASTLPPIGHRIAAAFARAGTIIKSAVVSGLGIAARAAKNLLMHTLKAVTGMSKLGKSSRRTGSSFGGMLKSMLFFSAFSAVLKSLKEGIDAMAKSSSSFNDTMSELKTSTASLRNSLITAFAPVLNVVVPILSMLISKLAAAINLVGQFFAALTGASSYTKAITQQQDYAASLDKTAGAAKEAKRQLAGFDEMNVLSDSSGGGGGGGADGGAGATFEEVPIDSGIAGFADRIKEAFANGEFYEIGTIIGEGINTIVSKVYNLLTGINWEGIGVAFAEGLNGIVHSVDWDMIGKTIGAYFMARLNLIYGAITTFDWKAAGAALGTAIMGLWNSIDWAKAGRTLSSAVIGLFNLISETVKTIDWQKVGNGIADYIAGIDWSGVASALFDGIGAALGGLAAFLWGLIEDAWTYLTGMGQEYAEEYGVDVAGGFLLGIIDGLCNIGKWIVENIFDPFINGFKDAFGINSPSTVMAEQGGFIVSGLLQGVTNAWSTITNFFSTALDTLGETLSDAWTSIKEGASTAWSKVSTTVSNAWTGLKTGVSNGATKVKETVSGAWSKVKEWTSEKWSSAKSAVSSTWESIKSSTASAGTKVKESVSSAWSKVKENVSSKLSSAKSAAATAWNSIKSTATSQNNGISATLSTTWGKIQSTMVSKMSSIKSSMSTTFTSLKNSASTWGTHICQNIASGISNSLWRVANAAKNIASNIKSFLGFSEPEAGPLSNFHTYMPDMVDLMVEGMDSNAGRAGKAAAGIAQAVSEEIQNGDYAVGAITPAAGIDSTLAGFSDKIADGFAKLMDRLQAIADGVTFTAPEVANGATPYRVAAAASGSKDQRDKDTSTDNDDISSVVIQSVNNATVAIVKAIQEYSQTNVNIDSDSLTDSIINEINRRTRMNGKSPLLT